MVSNVTPAPDLSDRRARCPVGRSNTAVWNLPLSYVFIRVFLYGRAAAARHSYHNRVQTTVSSYRMVHHGVSVTYTLFGYPGSSAPPCGALLTYYSLSSPSFRGPKSSFSFSFGSCRTAAPATKMFCKTNVCICTLGRARNPHRRGRR